MSFLSFFPLTFYPLTVLFFKSLASFHLIASSTNFGLSSFLASGNPRSTLIELAEIATATVLAIAVVVEMVLSFWVIFGYTLDRISAFNSIKRWFVGIAMIIMVSMGVLIGLLTNVISP